MKAGSFSNDAAMLAVAASAVKGGAVEDALPILRDLRDRMEDARSRRWLLPEVLRLIDTAEGSRADGRATRRWPRRPRAARRGQAVRRFESALRRIASVVSLVGTIVRIVVTQVLGPFTQR